MKALWRTAGVVGMVMASLGAAWADVIQNHAPVANPGGPYVVQLGDVLRLDGTGSWDPDFPNDSLRSFLWDLDHNGTFGDVSGAAPTVSWNLLFAALHPRVGQMSIIALKVEDAAGLWSSAGETTVRFVDVQTGGGTVPEPSSLALAVLSGAVLAGATRRLG